MRNRTGSPRRSGWMSVKVLGLLGLAGGAATLSGGDLTYAMTSEGDDADVRLAGAFASRAFFLPTPKHGDGCVQPDGECGECVTDPAPPDDEDDDGPDTPDETGEMPLPYPQGDLGFDDTLSSWGNGEQGSNPGTGDPVNLSDLSKSENAVDLRIKLPGSDYVWSRSYSSRAGFNFAGTGFESLGYGWAGNAFLYLDDFSGSNPIVMGQSREDVEFLGPDGNNLYQTRGVVTQELRELDSSSVQLTLSGYPGQTGTLDVWTLREPGKWEIDFYKRDSGDTGIPAGADGRMLQYRDAYGNTRTYEYDTLSNYGSGEVRLSKIYLNGTEDPDDTTDPSDALVDLTWFDIAGSNPNHDGYLDRVDVVRKNGGSTVVTQWVDYDYATELTAASVSLSGDVADSTSPEALLVQVSRGVQVDAVPGSLNTAAGGDYHVRFTQYRYHDNPSGSAYPSDPADAKGAYDLLKSVITPEQIEFLAQELNSDATGSEPSGTLGSIGQATYKAAEILLAQADTDDDYGAYSSGSTGISPLDLASKVISYGSGSNVEVQWLQADCGCSGGSSGFKRLEYTVLYSSSSEHSGPGLDSLDSAATGKTIKIEEFEGTLSSVYREYRYDLVYPRGTSGGDPAYLVGKALKDISSGQGWWVWWYDHHFESDGTSGNTAGRPGDSYDVYTPSAMGSYTPATSSVAASYSTVSTGGLVHRHEYNSDRRWTDSSEGTFVSSALSFEPVTRLTYPGSDSTSERTYLPSKIKRNRTGDAWSGISDDNVEVTEYSYNFVNTTTSAIRRVEISVEAEIVSENGPGVQTYGMVQMYDGQGQLVWMTAADGCMTYFGHDAKTGAVTEVIRNAHEDGSPDSSNPVFTPGDYGYTSIPSGWGTNDDGGELETAIDVDLLGRWTSHTYPGGSVTVIRREVSEDSERPGVAYLNSLFLPHKLAGSSPVAFSDPASRSWMDAAGKYTRASTYAVDGTAAYTPSSGTYTLDDELTRSTTVHDIHGQAIASRRWRDIAETSFTGSDAYDEWELAYDTYGRLETFTDPEGTLAIFGYDAINRLIKIEQKSDEPGATSVTLGEAYFDNGVAASQGVGNGNISRIDYYTNESGGGLSAATRSVYRAHDYRDRLIRLTNPVAPHYAFEYDNLDRLTRSATFSATPTDVDTPVASRGLLTERFYSQRGMVYKTAVAVDAEDSTPDYLESHVWYDEKGRVLKSHPSTSPAVKYAYDALDRVTDSYVTDARSDPKAGNTGNYGHADDVTSDTVFEQTSYTYSVDDSLLDLVERRVRNHDATAYGAIASGDGVTSWVGYFHDDADRRTHSVGFGTTKPLYETGGTAPTWPPASAPSATSGTYNDDDYIVSETIYNERGLVDARIDPKGDVTKYLYDDAERVIATIEAYDDAALASTPYAGDRWQFDDLNDDKDRVTSYVYNGVDDVVRMVAHLPDGSGGDDAQVTEYTYGVTAPASPGVTDSLVYNNRLLLKTAYPDETTGDAGSTSAYEVSYSYNALGELRSVTDQNGTLHVYERDTWGRVTADRVDTFGNTDLDNTVQRIEIDYDTLGRVDTIESLDAATGTASVLNGVTYEYTPLWQLKAMHQDMDGVASTDGTGGTETVEYVYTTSKFDSDPMSLAPHNYTRLADIVYPSDSVSSPTVSVRYGSVTARDNHISRIIGYNADGLTSPLVQYEHLGYGRIAEVDYAVPDVQMDRTFSHEGKRNTQGYSSQTAGVYPGWDRFGRVRVQAWMDGGLDTIRPGQSPDPNVNVPGKPPLIEELQTYDRASIRTGKLDARPGAKRANRDYDFGYDDLDRLTSAKRGSWNDAYSPVTWTANPTGSGIGNSEAWTYDALGNWDELLTDGNHDDDFLDTGSGAGYADLAETRGHNMANELDDIDEDQNVGGVDLSFLYDDSGNRTKKTYVSGGGYDTYTYDAWNRLVKIERTDNADPAVTTDLALYEYNGRHHRIQETSGGQMREMYYGGGWRLLEEHVDEPSPTTDREIQHFWGKRYIDDAVMHRIRDDDDTTWSLTRTFYHLTDPMYSTLAIIDGGGTLKERVHYSSYGVPTAYRPGDVNGDGTINYTADFVPHYAVSDIADVGTNTNYTVELDLDSDGDVDSVDFTGWLIQAGKSTLGASVLSDTAVVDNRTGYDGYRWEPETQLWHVRNRAYDSYAGRWLQRDPLGYVDGTSEYQYVSSAAMDASDPSGLVLRIDPGTGDRNKRRKKIQRTIDALELLCPSVQIDDDNEVTIPGPECEDDPPGCKLLRKLINDKDIIIISPTPVKKNTKPFDNDIEIYYPTDTSTPDRKIIWNPERVTNPFKKRNPDGTLAPDRMPEEFELLWHELIHALHSLQGTHPIRPSNNYGTDDEEGTAHEERKTIDEFNEYRKWYREEYGIDVLTDRDPYGHPYTDPIWKDKYK